MQIEPLPEKSLRSEIPTDPDLAAKTMGEGNRTVLPAPLIGDYVIGSRPWVKLTCTIPEDASPLFLDRLVRRLQETYFEIVALDPGTEVPSATRETLVTLGFRAERHFEPTVGVDQDVLIWRSPLA